MPPTVTINARGEDRLMSGHPWIYRADVSAVHAEGGDRVLVRGPRDRPLGSAFYSDRSQIALRILTRGDEPADDGLIRRRIEQAVTSAKDYVTQAIAQSRRVAGHFVLNYFPR